MFGRTYASAEQDFKNRIGYVPQEPAFYPDKTVQWLARFSAPYFARWDGAGFYTLLDEFKVNPLKKVKHLSGAQKTLLSLALALSHGAELLILDEPTAGLDVVHRRALLDRLRAFVADGDMLTRDWPAFEVIPLFMPIWTARQPTCSRTTRAGSNGDRRR